MARKTKGIKIDERVFIERIGYSCNGVPWETPYVVFVTSKNGRVRWHSDKVAEYEHILKPGTTIHISGFIYGPALNQTLRKVDIERYFNQLQI